MRANNEKICLPFIPAQMAQICLLPAYRPWARCSELDRGLWGPDRGRKHECGPPQAAPGPQCLGSTNLSPKCGLQRTCRRRRGGMGTKALVSPLCIKIPKAQRVENLSVQSTRQQGRLRERCRSSSEDKMGQVWRFTQHPKLQIPTKQAIISVMVSIRLISLSDHSGAK